MHIQVVSRERVVAVAKATILHIDDGDMSPPQPTWPWKEVLWAYLKYSLV